MEGFTFSLIIGFVLGSSIYWLTARINDRYTQRERTISRLLLKRARKD